MKKTSIFKTTVIATIGVATGYVLYSLNKKYKAKRIAKEVTDYIERESDMGYEKKREYIYLGSIKKK